MILVWLEHELYMETNAPRVSSMHATCSELSILRFSCETIIATITELMANWFPLLWINPHRQFPLGAGMKVVTDWNASLGVYSNMYSGKSDSRADKRGR